MWRLCYGPLLELDQANVADSFTWTSSSSLAAAWWCPEARPTIDDELQPRITFGYVSLFLLYPAGGSIAQTAPPNGAPDATIIEVVVTPMFVTPIATL